MIVTALASQGSLAARCHIVIPYGTQGPKFLQLFAGSRQHIGELDPENQHFGQVKNQT